MVIKLSWRLKIAAYKEYIVLLGLLVGLVHIAGFLPESLPLAEQYTEYVYIGFIAFAGYVFWDFYWNAPSAKFARTVPSSPSSDPSFRRKIERDRGAIPKTRIPVSDGGAARMGIADSDIFEKFKKD